MSVDVETGKDAGTLRELLHLAIPLVLSSGSLTLMHVVDRIFLTWYSPDALAASMPTAMLHWTLLSLALGTAAYLNSFVAQYDGARRPERVGAVLWQGAYFSVGSGVLLLVFVPLAEPIFQAIDHPPAVRQMEIEYFRILMIGSGAATLSNALSCFYSGRGRTTIVLWVNLFGTFVNLVLDYWFIFGGWGLPEMGIWGAGLATVLGYSAMCLAYILLMAGGGEAKDYRLAASWRFDPDLFRRMIRFGFPNGVHFFVDIGVYTMFMMLVGKLGRVELAATGLALNLNILAFVPMLGFSTAVMTIVGKRIGEGRPRLAIRSTWIAYALTFVYLACFSLVYVTVPEMVIAPYAAKAEPGALEDVRPVVIVLLRFVAVYSLFDGMNIIFGSAVRGAGDTRFAMLMTLFGGLAVMVLPTYAWLTWGNGGIYGAWTFATLFITFLGLGFLGRFLQGKWLSMRVIESADEFEPLPVEPNTEAAVSPAAAAPEPEPLGRA